MPPKKRTTKKKPTVNPKLAKSIKELEEKGFDNLIEVEFNKEGDLEPMQISPEIIELLAAEDVTVSKHAVVSTTYLITPNTLRKGRFYDVRGCLQNFEQQRFSVISEPIDLSEPIKVKVSNLKDPSMPFVITKGSVVAHLLVRY